MYIKSIELAVCAHFDGFFLFFWRCSRYATFYSELVSDRVSGWVALHNNNKKTVEKKQRKQNRTGEPDTKKPRKTNQNSNGRRPRFHTARINIYIYLLMCVFITIFGTFSIKLFQRTHVYSYVLISICSEAFTVGSIWGV